MKRALFCFMVISFFLCLGSYGQAAQFMDRVSLTVHNIDIVEGFSGIDGKENWLNQKLNLFTVIYNDESMESHTWENDVLRIIDTTGPSDYMTFLSDATYKFDEDFICLLNFFELQPPVYPHVRQVYGGAIIFPPKITTTYDYVFWNPDLNTNRSGFTLDYTPSAQWASGSVTINDGNGNEAYISFGPPYDIQRVIIPDDVEIGYNSVIGIDSKINSGVTIGDYVVVGSDVSIGKDTIIGDYVEIGNGTVIGKDCTIEDDVTIGEEVVIRSDVTVFKGEEIPNGTVIGK